MNFEQNINNNLHAEFAKNCKKVEVFKTQNRKLPTDVEKINSYINDIAISFNNFVDYIKSTYDTLDEDNKNIVNDRKN